MKVSTTKSWVFVTLLATGGLSALNLARAQEPNRPTDAVRKIDSFEEYTIRQPPQRGQSPQVAQNTFFSPYSGGGSVSSGGRGADSSWSNAPNRAVSAASATSAIRKAAEAVRDAKGDDAKSAAQKKLAELLNKSYDEDMVQREHELTQIEERLTKLRELLNCRRAKKQDIIDLQTKVALNEADGLGFYDNQRPAESNASSIELVAPRIVINPPTPFVDPAPSTDSAPVVPKAKSR